MHNLGIENSLKKYETKPQSKTYTNNKKINKTLRLL